ncbi:MAG: hypothetical protein K1000chlam3_01564, partial [Chlamydiae bacterium]|nr:hypothetical protein [Chlamydiota bacterium]
PFSKANNPWRYGCHRIDDETGLVFIDGIYYDPNLHTFLTQPERQLEPPQLFQVPKMMLNLK